MQLTMSKLDYSHEDPSEFISSKDNIGVRDSFLVPTSEFRETEVKMHIKSDNRLKVALIVTAAVHDWIKYWSVCCFVKISTLTRGIGYPLPSHSAISTVT
jgi:hypothetical protein